MKCPNCKLELEEGKFYCPGCGYEIQIVSDFEPEIEEKINNVLEDITIGFVEESKAEQREKRLKMGEKRAVFYSIAAAVCIILFFLTALMLLNRNTSAESFLAKAEKAAAKDNYEKAIEYALQAVEMDTKNLKVREMLGQFYEAAGKTSLAITTFQDIIVLDGENEEAYEHLISIYEAEKDYSSINALVSASSSPEIKNLFSRYIADIPAFSYPQGTYDEMIAIKLTANAAGKIYYTTDGSEPTVSSYIYQTPIQLEDGIYTIKAFFENEYGIKSDVCTQIYQIHLEEAHEPEISLDDGNYTEPQMISVSVPDGENIYYTVDGSNPTMDSIAYRNPIALPLGETTYKFVSYSADGKASEVVTRHYVFTFISVVDLHQASSLLVAGLCEKGVIAGPDGSLAGKNGHNLYVCSTVISINQRAYYMFVEYYEDLLGTDNRTGNLYCIDAETGILCRAVVDEMGYYSVVSF